MKRIGSLVLSITLIFTMVFPYMALAGGGDSVTYLKVYNPDPADRLNLREKPSQSATSLGRYYTGVSVRVMDYVNDDWAYVAIGVDSGDIFGYMMTKFLTPSTDISIWPMYYDSGTIALNSMQDFSGVQTNIQNAKIEIMGFTDKAWHVYVTDTNGVTRTGFIKAGDPKLTEYTGKERTEIAVVNNPNPSERLNLRVSPSKYATSLGRYYNGTEVTVAQRMSNGWAAVHIGSLSGYMQEAYLATGTEAKRVQNVMPVYTSTSSAWEIYGDPSCTNWQDVMGYLGIVEVMGFTDTLYHVRYRIGNSYKTGFIPTKAKLLPCQMAVVNNPDPKERLHVRTGKGESYPSYGKFYNGVEVYVLTENPQKQEWVSVVISDRESYMVSGYMKTKYLAFGDAAKKVKNVCPMVTLLRADGKDIVMREFYGQLFEQGSINTFPSGTKATLLALSDKYYLVSVFGQVGAVDPQYVK